MERRQIDNGQITHKIRKRSLSSTMDERFLPTGQHPNGRESIAITVEEDGDELPIGVHGGNWGNKLSKGSQWVKRGKMAPWASGRDEWEFEESARKRIRRLLPSEMRSPSPPSLPHLRSTSPAIVAPYVQTPTQHGNFTAHVMDEAIQHSYRSSLLSDLQAATCNLIEGEGEMKRALGRLWTVLADAPFLIAAPPSDGVSKREDADEISLDDMPDAARPEHAQSPVTRLFVSPYAVNVTENQMLSPQQQREQTEKSLAVLRDIGDDGREYVERLEEVREVVGEVQAQRKGVWTVVRERALKEMSAEAKR